MSEEAEKTRKPLGRGCTFLIFLFVLGLVALGAFIWVARQFEGFEARPTRIEMVNEFDHRIVLVGTGSSESVEEAFERQEGRFVVRESGGSFVRSPDLDSTGCVPSNFVQYFLRPDDDVVFDEDGVASPGGFENFELVATLGPGFCFETRDEVWVIGDPYLTASDN